MEIKAGKPAGQTERIELLKQKVADDEQEMRLNVRMTKREYRQLQRFAFEQEMKISDVVRKAVTEYMKSKIGESAGPLGQLGADPGVGVAGHGVGEGST